MYGVDAKGIARILAASNCLFSFAEKQRGTMSGNEPFGHHVPCARRIETPLQHERQINGRFRHH
jgi:hypothetical protein